MTGNSEQLHCTRSKSVINYKELADLKLPQTKRSSKQARSDALHPVEVLE